MTSITSYRIDSLLKIAAAAMLAVAPMAAAELSAKTASTPGVEVSNPDGPVRGPVLGYLFDEVGRGLRPILGIPGASYIGGVLNLGVLVDLAEASPNQDYAVVRDIVSGEMRYIDLRRDTPALRPIPGAITGADRVFFSPTGESGLLYDRDAARVQILKTLRTAPTGGALVDLSGLDGVLTALAINDAGNLLLAATSKADAGSLYSLTAEGDSRLLGPLGRASSIAFVPGGNDALIADIGRNELVHVANAAGAAQLMVLAGEKDGVRQPTAVAATDKGNRAIVVSAETRSVITVPIAGGAAVSLPCDCDPKVLRRLRGDSVFRMTDTLERPLYVLEAELRTAAQNQTQPDQRIVFVPPAAAISLQESAPARVPRTRGQR